MRHVVHAQIAMFATVCLDGPRQPLNMTDKTEFNPPGCSTSCIDRNVIFRAATGISCLPADNALSKSRMDTGWPRAIGSWLDVLRGLAGRLARIRRKAFHFSDLRARSGTGFRNGTHEAGSQAPLLPVKFQTGVLPIYIFFVRPDCAQGWARPTNGSDRGSLRSHDLTLFVRHFCRRYCVMLGR